MESWENKIIGDKIESLQQLPAGYLPDLSSKWEIIEAGLPVKKNSNIPLLIRWSVAAAIVIGILLTTGKVNQSNEGQEGIMSAISMPLLPVPKIVQIEPVAIIEKQAVMKEAGSHKAIRPVCVPDVKVIAKGENQPSAADELSSITVDPVVDSAVVETDELASIVPQEQTRKHAKRRTFQKDFNDGLLVIDTGYSKPASPQFSLKLQLRKSTGDDVQPSRRLQLKQVL